MAVLRHLANGRRFTVQADHVVGRSPLCQLHIEEQYVSTHHASLRWTGESWEVKDLGSRNGTFVEQRRIPTGSQHRVQAGTHICFGHAQQEWVLDDDSAPSVMVLPAAGGEGIMVHQDLVALPSDEEPIVVVYRRADGMWVLERPDEALTPIEDQATFEAGGKTWRFCCPRVVSSTSTAEEQYEVGKLSLHFRVSRDEEHVEVRAMAAGTNLDLGSRTHNYLLLTLARMRLRDAAEGIPDTACGWMYQDDLLRGLNTSATQLNLEVFRIRQQLAALKVRDAASVIERRPRSRQLRIGVAGLTVDLL